MKKLKALINKILDVPKLIVTLWIILWLVLFILVAFKFCFNIWYPIVVRNENFIAVCDFIDSIPIVRYGVYILFYILNLNIWSLMAMKKGKYYNKFHLILFNVLIISSYLLKLYNNLYGMLFEILYLVLIPILINLKYKPFKNNILNVVFPIIVYLLINLWQSNMVFIRGIDEIISELPTMINLILQIDYYVFLINSWIGVTLIMGLLGGGWWWGRQLTKYEAYKEKELKKANPDMDYVNYCDSKIKECKEKLNEIKK